MWRGDFKTCAGTNGYEEFHVHQGSTVNLQVNANTDVLWKILHDFICPPSQAQLMHVHIPQSRLVVFEHSGHFPWIEEPVLFIHTVKEWLE